MAPAAKICRPNLAELTFRFNASTGDFIHSTPSALLSPSLAARLARAPQSQKARRRRGPRSCGCAMKIGDRLAGPVTIGNSFIKMDWSSATVGGAMTSSDPTRRLFLRLLEGTCHGGREGVRTWHSRKGDERCAARPGYAGVLRLRAVERR